MTETGVVEYNITDAVIAEYHNLYMELVITDLEDKEQFDSVHSARMVIKGKRVEVEKRRKELKADALAWGKKVDAEAKRIFGKLEPIETHLMDEENKVLDEQKRIEAEEKEREKQIVQGRIDALLNVGVTLSYMEIATMTDQEYADTLTHATDAYQAEQKRLADEEAARIAENLRLEKIRFEQEAEATRLAEENRKILEAQESERKKIEAEKAALQAERDKIEAEKRKEKERVEREALEKKLAEDAKIQAEKDIKDKAEREAKEAEERKAAEDAEQKRQEELKPDREKLDHWINSWSLPPEHPVLNNNVSKLALKTVLNIIYEAFEEANKVLKNL